MGLLVTTLAQGEVFSDFESGLGGWLETDYGDKPATITALASPVGGGGQAMKVTQTGDGFSWNAEMAGGAGSEFLTLMEAALSTAPEDYRLEFQVHYVGAEMPISSFANLTVALQDDNDTGWSSVDGEGLYGSGDIGTDKTVLVSLPLSAFQGGAEASLDSGSEWYKIAIAMNGDWGVGQGSAYFDNFSIEAAAPPAAAAKFDYETGLQGWELFSSLDDAGATVNHGVDISATGDAMCLGRSGSGFSWLGAVSQNPGDAFYDSVNTAVNSGSLENYSLVFDVIYLATDFPAGSGTFANISLAFNDEVSGWTSLDGLGLYGSADFGTDKSVTVSVGLDQLGIDETSEFYQLIIGSSGDWDGAATGTVYIDNIQVVENDSQLAFDFEPGVQGWQAVSFATDTAADIGHGLDISETGNALCLERAQNEFSWVAQVTTQAGSVFYDQVAAGMADDPDAYRLEFDVIFLGSDFPTGSGSFVNTSIAFNDENGWTDAHGLALYGEEDFGSDLVVPVVVPLSELGIDVTSGWFQLNVATNGDWSGAATGTVYLDNVRITSVEPEPTGVIAFDQPSLTHDLATGATTFTIGIKEAADESAPFTDLPIDWVFITGNEVEINLIPTTGQTRYALPSGQKVSLIGEELTFKFVLEESPDLVGFTTLELAPADVATVVEGRAQIPFTSVSEKHFFRVFTLLLP